MKGPILALCLLLLVSAAAATGSYNCVNVYGSQEVSGNCLTGAAFAQVTNVDANLLGTNIDATQFLGLQANDNCITGSNNGETNFIQAGDMVANDTGCNDFDLQAELLAANENCLTTGNITQIAAQHADTAGSDNYVVQGTAAALGTVDLPCFCLGSPNCVTNSDLSQLSSLNACVTGTDNLAAQVALQGTFDNCMTDTGYYQQASLNADILGCNNNGICCDGAGSYVDTMDSIVGPYSDGTGICLPIQVSVQYTDDNCMTNALFNQMNCMDEQVTGDCNSVGQFDLGGVSDDCITSGSLLQMSNFKAAELGCNNAIGQSIELNNACNSITGGNIIQQATANTND